MYARFKTLWDLPKIGAKNYFAHSMRVAPLGSAIQMILHNFKGV